MQRSPHIDAESAAHPLLERQWSLDEFALLKLFLALVGCALSLLTMVFFGGYSLIVGPAAAALLLVGGSCSPSPGRIGISRSRFGS